MINQIHQTIILVTDIDDSVQFYRDGLGLPLSFATPDWAESRLATGSLTLRRHEGDPPGDSAWGAGRVTLGVGVADLQTLATHMAAGGVTFNLPPTEQPEAGGMMALVCDPDGIPIMLYQPTAVSVMS
ncbi:MAG: VOC family protein [Candidatus Sericytochromatia bacterium]|nr:VOC family protein [Candidatus Sericytochromatia bacterium]